MKPETLTAGLAVAHLYRRFPCPEFFAAHELDLSGLTRSRAQMRRADFAALRLWGDRPGHLLGFEVKVSRSDFLHELKNPDKRQPLEDVCSACYFVAPSYVLNASELPENWGWLELNSAGLRMRREARHRRVENSGAVYHRLMKRVIDSRWHDRARKPALVDWPKEVFSYAGKEITPGQLHALALELMVVERGGIESAARAAARREMGEALDEARAGLEEIRNAVADGLGCTSWDLVRLDRAGLTAHIQAATQGGAGLSRVGAKLDRCLGTFDSLERLLRTARSELTGAISAATPPTEVSPDA